MIRRYQTSEMNLVFSEDSRFRYMLQVEIAVAQVQAEMGLIPQSAAQAISKKSRINLARIEEIEQTTKHDVIAFVSQVAETVGTHGKFLHFGLTSSDVLDTALSLQVREAYKVIFFELSALKKTLKTLIQKHKNSLCAGRTHGIFAELTTFGFKLAGFYEELLRVEERMLQAEKQFLKCKLSGAVGTSSALSLTFEKKVAQKLKLSVEKFATQVIPRDRHAEVFISLAFLAAFLERLAVELRHLQRSEVSEVIEGFSKGQKGSSAMPHKKNPISAENITGLSRLIKGYAWTSFENIPLWHERDISHSSNERIMFQDSFTLSHYSIRRMNKLLSEIYVDEKRMEKNSQLFGGILYSSHVLLHLVHKHKLSREEAYQLIQTAAHQLKPDQHLKDYLATSVATKKYFTETDLQQLFSGQRYLKSIVERIKHYGP